MSEIRALAVLNGGFIADCDQLPGNKIQLAERIFHLRDALIFVCADFDFIRSGKSNFGSFSRLIGTTTNLLCALMRLSVIVKRFGSAVFDRSHIRLRFGRHDASFRIHQNHRLIELKFVLTPWWCKHLWKGFWQLPLKKLDLSVNVSPCLIQFVPSTHNVPSTMLVRLFRY